MGLKIIRRKGLECPGLTQHRVFQKELPWNDIEGTTVLAQWIQISVSGGWAELTSRDQPGAVVRVWTSI